jgi:hypothetical protein
MKLIVGFIGICFVPFAIILLAFESACAYVVNLCNERVIMAAKNRCILREMYANQPHESPEQFEENFDRIF